MRAKWNACRTTLFTAGGCMLLLSPVFVAIEIQLLRVLPLEGHVLDLVMCTFAAGYSLYAGISLPLVGNALGRLKPSAKRSEA